MQCAELEERIGQLLDNGRPPDDDPSVVDHAAICIPCGTLLEAYRQMLAGVDALPLPDLSRTFVLRTVDRAFSAERCLSDRADHRRHTGRRALWATAATLAIAASLLVAAALWRSTPTQNVPGSGDLATTANGGAAAAAHGGTAPTPLQNLPSEQIHAVCLSTGQSLAALPVVFRRVDTTRLTGHIRPVVRPMGAAWKAVKRTLPSGDPTPPEVSGDTGWIPAVGQILVA